MAHSQETAEAVDAPEIHDQDSAVAALRDMEIADQDDVPDNEEALSDDEIADVDLEEEDVGEETEESDEPEEPAIDAPASLNAEEKAAFAQLPAEAQRAWAASETRRNTQVQEATTKASNAQREAQARAAAADAQAKQEYAQQLSQFVSAYEPQMPDPQQFHDLQSYNAAKAQYDYAKAQHDQIVQQVTQFGTEAQNEAQQGFIQQRDRELLQIPEIANEETRKEYLDRAMSMASELGYDLTEISQGMVARDVKALAQVAEWKDGFEKYKAAMSRKMTRVRAGKNRTAKPGVAQPKGSGQRKARETSFQRLKQTGSREDAVAALSHLIKD